MNKVSSIFQANTKEDHPDELICFTQLPKDPGVETNVKRMIITQTIDKASIQFMAQFDDMEKVILPGLKFESRGTPVIQDTPKSVAELKEWLHTGGCLPRAATSALLDAEREWGDKLLFNEDDTIVMEVENGLMAIYVFTNIQGKKFWTPICLVHDKDRYFKDWVELAFEHGLIENDSDRGIIYRICDVWGDKTKCLIEYTNTPGSGVLAIKVEIDTNKLVTTKNC